MINKSPNDFESLNFALIEILNNSVTKAIMNKDQVSQEEIIDLLKKVKANRAADFNLAA